MSNSFRVHGQTVTLAPQTAKILSHLKLVGEISGVEAVALYKSRSVTKRVSEINAEAEPFLGRNLVNSAWHTDVTGQRYKRYFLSAVDQAELQVAA